jgi:hypothetical protein
MAVDVDVSPGSTVLLDGRNGQQQWSFVKDEKSLTPLFTSVDGQGDDFVCKGFSEDCNRATIMDGRNLRTLFVFDPPGRRVTDTSAGHLTHDNHADLVLTSVDTDGLSPTITVVDGATHQVRWSWTS